MSEEPDSQDEELNEALAAYVEAPASKGLEARILAHISVRTANQRRKRKLSLIAALAAAAAGFVLWQGRPEPSVQTKPEEWIDIARNQNFPTRPNALTRPAERVADGRRVHHKMQRIEPKLPQFPSKCQIGSQERALLALAQYAARGAIQQSNDIQNPIKPIVVVALEIKPLKLEPEEDKYVK